MNTIDDEGFLWLGPDAPEAGAEVRALRGRIVGHVRDLEARASGVGWVGAYADDGPDP